MLSLKHIHIVTGVLLIGGLIASPFVAYAEEKLILENDSTRSFSARTIVINKNNGQGNPTLIFGQSINEQLLWDSAASKFKFTDNLDVQGTMSGASVHAAGGNVTVATDGTSIFNVNEHAINFRIATDNQTNMLFIHGTNNRIGIKTSSPETTLEIIGTASGEHLHFGRLLTGSGQTIFESSETYLPAATFMDVNGNGTGALIDSEATGAPVLALDGFVEGSDASLAPHIIFGRQNIFDTNLYRSDANVLRTDDSFYVGGTLSGATLYNSQSTEAGNVLVSRQTGPPVWQTHTGSLIWYIDGPLVTGTGQGAMITMPFALTVKSLDLRAKGDPGGASIIVDINEAGSTIFSTRPEIDAGATTEDGNHAFSDTSFAEGSEITIDIDQVGSGSSGSGLTIMLHGIRQ